MKVSSYFTVGTESILPTCDATTRNKMVCVNGISDDESDKCYICLKSSGGIGYWSQIHDFDYGVITLKAVNNSYFWAGVREGYLLNSTDGAEAWTNQYDTGDLYTFSYGGNGSKLYAGTGHSGSAKVFISSDGGGTWTLDETFGATVRSVQYITKPIFGGFHYFGTHGAVGVGDVWERHPLSGVYSKVLDTTSTSINGLEVSGINGYIYAMTREGAIYEKQSQMGAFAPKKTGTTGKNAYVLEDNGSVAIIGGGSNPFLYATSDYTAWTTVSIPSWVTSGYSYFREAKYFDGSWYIGAYGGSEGGDVLKWNGDTSSAGEWSADLTTGYLLLRGIEIYDGELYAGAYGTIGSGILYKLQAGIESFNWIKIAEG